MRGREIVDRGSMIATINKSKRETIRIGTMYFMLLETGCSELTVLQKLLNPCKA